MIAKALKKLNKKHLLIVGGQEFQRQKLVDEIIRETKFEFFRFPKQMKTLEDYIDFVRKKNLYRPWYSKKSKFNNDQVLDFHRDWIAGSSSLVVIEEIQEMEQTWKTELLKYYITSLQNRKKGDKTIRLIISQEKEDGLLDALAKKFYVNDNDRRTPWQIIQGGIELIEIGES